MNKKGFTLIEILVVIVLLGVLTTFTVVSISKIREDSLANLYKDKITYIETGAKEWGNDNLNKLSDNCYYVSVETIITKGYISGDDVEKNKLLDPRDNGEYLNNKCVCVKYEDVYSSVDVSTTRFQVTAKYTDNTCSKE